MTCHFVRWTSMEALPDLQRLPDDVISSTHAFSIKQRERFLKSRALLAEMMFYFFGYPMLPRMSTRLNGRPCFADTHLPDISIGYAGNTIGIMLSEEGKVGMDIELVHVRAASQAQTSRQDYSQAEKIWIDAQTDPLEAATQLNTIRHAVLKIAETCPGPQESLKLHPASGRLRIGSLPAVEVMSDVDDYLAWACAHTPMLNRLVLWNYTANDGLTKTGEILQQHPQSLRYMRLTSHSMEKAR
ncbi:hypothetical protein FJU30_15515 [Affinibrenneria salicis]|uniref:Phosphopantetheinyl transferase n=1 Tax=Affinibrenneria salicis TaxID=2590031 RepID=A0A5J5FXF7_9GAMM|nr:hypothetical protein [Affinibrenneria salicis]KAA8998413.1 hypothetical protein FJU30_15515 [Affinibrenneria salicis]